MIVKAVFYGLVFVVIVIFLAQMFDIIYSNLDLTINAVDEMRKMMNIEDEVTDRSLIDYTFNALTYAVFLFPLSAVSILLIWGVHSRRR